MSSPSPPQPTRCLWSVCRNEWTSGTIRTADSANPAPAERKKTQVTSTLPPARLYSRDFVLTLVLAALINCPYGHTPTATQKRLVTNRRTHLSSSVQLREGFAGNAEELGHRIESLPLGVIDLVPHLEVLQAGHSLCWLDARNCWALGIKSIAELDHLYHKCLKQQHENLHHATK